MREMRQATWSDRGHYFRSLKEKFELRLDDKKESAGLSLGSGKRATNRKKLYRPKVEEEMETWG